MSDPQSDRTEQPTPDGTAPAEPEVVPATPAGDGSPALPADGADAPAGAEDDGAEDDGAEDDGAEDDGGTDSGDGDEGTGGADDDREAASRRVRRRRNRLAGALIGVLCLLLGFAFAVQVRSTDTGTGLTSAREEDLVRILDELNAREDRLRQQIADQRSALDQLGSSDSRSATALQEARQRAQAIGILNGTIAAQGPGLRMVIRDPGDAVRVADLLDAIEELRGAGAETMQIDGIRVGVSTAVSGDPGALRLDGKPIGSPYEVLVIGSPQDMETAMNIPGGVVQRISGRGGTVDITQEQQVVVDALRPLDQPQYAAPKSGG
jgi:uncharacterized protein YlxW (UPF0749 family)